MQPNEPEKNSLRHLSPKIVSAGFLILRHTPAWSFLLLRHPTRWDIPKGHCDPGETELETAWRELSEETGLGPDQVTLIADFRWEHEYQVRLREFNNELRNKRLVVFLGTTQGEFPLNITEHQGYEWFLWPPTSPIQAQTIDPLLKAVAEFFRLHPTALNL
jgi:bis(5'-nucleosidyl)-tetraphosphatase